VSHQDDRGNSLHKKIKTGQRLGSPQFQIAQEKVRNDDIIRVLGVGRYLDEHDLDVVLLAGCQEHVSSRSGRVGGIVERDNTLFFLEPIDHVVQGLDCSLPAGPLSLWIGGIEKIVQLVRAVQLATIVADVEDLGLDPEPHQVSADYNGKTHGEGTGRTDTHTQTKKRLAVSSPSLSIDVSPLNPFNSGSTPHQSESAPACSVPG